MEIAIELKGNPTENHCSYSSSINACNWLNIKQEKCKLFNANLSYDWEEHAYARSQMCLDNELSILKENDD